MFFSFRPRFLPGAFAMYLQPGQEILHPGIKAEGFQNTGHMAQIAVDGMNAVTPDSFL
jgi:hypothetical protein